jgi:iron complex transport system substrate-binding protein
VLLALVRPVEARAQGTILDDRGREVRLERPGTRVIALYGALNEILFALDLGGRIVGRTEADARPESIQALPVIGTHMRPNVERILALKPDLVLQMSGRGAGDETLAALEGFGVATAFFEAASFEELDTVTDRIGRLMGAENKAREVIQAQHHRLDRIRTALEKSPSKPRVFYEVRYPNLLAAGQKSMARAIIDRAGGRLVVDRDDKIVRLGEEAVLMLDPEAYLIQQGPMNPAPVPLKDRPHFQTLAVLRSGRSLVVDERDFMRPGPRNVDAVETLAQWLHPVCFFRRAAVRRTGPALTTFTTPVGLWPNHQYFQLKEGSHNP